MIDSRMQAVMNFVSFGSRVADIGADHGYLSIELAKSGRAAKIIATEKNIYPCEAALKNISAAGFGEAIDVRLGDGLQVLTAGEVDTICIAGMGGALAENDWTIDDEDLAESAGIIYEIISAVKVPSAPKSFKRDSSPLLKKFFAQRVEKLQRVLSEMSKSPAARASDKFAAVQAEIDTLRRLC